MAKITKKNAIESYKVFNPDWTCKGFQFEIGKKYKHKGSVIACRSGFHACKRVACCFNYYDFNPQNKIALVLQWGIIDESENDKIASEHIELIKEITWAEMLELANTGKGNSGNWNSGDSNSGDSNSGNRNSGDSNSGNCNSGNCNSGNRNSGNWNSGNWNSGDSNSGNSNSGNWNSGDWNSGNRNSGNWNSGDWNSGNRNSGNWNSGDWNSGFFNSNQPEEIRVFNKVCKRKDWKNADKPNFIFFNLTKWINYNEMDSAEKKVNPNAETCGGYLKTLSYKDAWAEAYKRATKNDVELLKKLPNFDADIFFEISGIKLSEV